MKTFKFMLVALVVSLSTSMYAGEYTSNSYAENNKKNSISYEIEKYLRNSNLVIDEDFTVTVIFGVTENNRIDIKSITSPNEEVNRFLELRLQDHKLKGEGWFAHKLYELPVRVKASK